MCSSDLPDLGAPAEGRDKAKVTLSQEKEKDALHEDITVTADVPLRPPPPQSIVDVAKAGLSQSLLDGDHGEDHPLHPSHGKYDIM